MQMFEEIKDLLAGNENTNLDCSFFELVLKRLDSFGYIPSETDAWLFYYAGITVEQTVRNKCNTASIPDGLLYDAVDCVCGEVLSQKHSLGQLDVDIFDFEQIGKSLKIGDITVDYGSNALSNEEKFKELVNVLKLRGDWLCYRRLKW